MQRKPTVIVVGAGISACISALRAHESGAHVVLISSSIPARAHSSCFSDGMNLEPVMPDSIDEFTAESIAASSQLMTGERAHILANSPSEILSFFSRIGVNFATTSEGHLQRYRVFGSEHKRAGHFGLKLSKSILSALYGQIMRIKKSPSAEIYFGMEFLSLITASEGECAGVVALDLSDMKVRPFVADAVIVCTGGYHGIFADSTASLYCDGSATYSCYEAGASLSDLEMVQYHPFCLNFNSKFVPIPEMMFAGKVNCVVGGESSKTFSIENGRTFGVGAFKEAAAAGIATKYHDGVVGRGEFTNLKFENLDALIDENTGPMIKNIEFITGKDLFEDEICAYPAANRSLGGIAVDIDQHSTFEGLFSAGFAASSESAGILGGNEILMSAKTAMVAGQKAAEYAKRVAGTRGEVKNSTIEAAVSKEEDVFSEIRSRNGSENISEVSIALKETMSSYAGLLKNAEGLSTAKEKIEEIKKRSEDIVIGDVSQLFNTEAIAIYRLKKSISLASLYIDSATLRRETRGSHVRIDEPSTQKSAHHSVVSKNARAELKQKVM